MTRGLVIVGLIALASCRDRGTHPPAAKGPLETAIARDLTARLATPVSAHCATISGSPRCEAQLADGTTIPIEVGMERGDWVWHVPGFVIAEQALTEYVAGALAEMHIEQRPDCGPAVHVINPGEVVACKLSGGGVAVVRPAADGSGDASLELVLDAQAAAARTEKLTPVRDGELIRISRDLEGRAGTSDGEDEQLAADGGVPSP